MSVLVLAGALGTTRTIWEGQLGALGRTHELRFVDYPERGPATVAGIAERALAALPQRFSFCGISLGGMVGMWLGANAPDRVDRLVVACTGAKLGSRDEYRARAELVRREGPGVVAEGAQARWFTAGFRDSAPARRIVDELRAFPAETYAACAEAVGDWDFRGELHRVAPPTLAVFGAEDTVTTPEVRAELLEGIPGVREATIPHAAHLANVEQPDAFNDAVVNHLRSGA